MDQRPERTRTSSFGAGRREGHDSSDFYSRFVPPVLSDDDTIGRSDELLRELGSGRLYEGSIDRLGNLPSDCVALVVTSPPYFVGKEYELAITGNGSTGTPVPETYLDYLDMVRNVLTESVRVLEPGGRIAVNVANLGRKPYRSLSADLTHILQDDLGLLMRGEIIWMKSEASAGSCAWGSFARASNPVLRDTTERVLVASKGRFSRARSAKKRRADGLPHESTLANDEFVEITRDVWRIDAESARAVGHPAPFPIDLPRRLIDLYTYRGDIVLDPFVGSGTTMVAAARSGRIGVGYDTDPDYVELATRRLDTELERLRVVEQTTERLDNTDRAGHGTVVDNLDSVARHEYFQARAIREGKKAQDIARRQLAEAGFTSISDKARHPKGIIDFTFLVTHPDNRQRWWVEVPGAFTTSKPGLQRTEAVWKLLGRLHVLESLDERGQRPNVLILTPQLPSSGSAADRALRAVGPAVIFDAIELYDPAGLERLRRYAGMSDPVPLEGFWSQADINSRFPS